MVAATDNTAENNSERSLFLEAISLAVAQERNAFLDEACGANAGLRQRVDALLNAHDKAGATFLDPPPLGSEGFQNGEEPPTVRDHNFPGSVADGRNEKPGTTIDGYELVRKCGEGGFAIVHEAQQLRPVKRRVALKLLKPGMDSEQVIARFGTERQALAMMNHPNIASVYDAGKTSRDLPYFVMEFVDGEPITKYCDRNQCAIEQRLRLFVQVCRAIQHAHQKAIIHRDLKPSNVLVTVQDGRPVPMVIDFGIAKAITKDHADGLTSQGQFLGTPQYMSPEQAGLNNWDIDTRSDIYSLGVLLYELIAGTTPLDARALYKGGYAAMERMIREENPPKPTNRLAAQGVNSAEIAGNRAVDPEKLQRQVRGDLDLIVMMALEKDRTRRYETANALANDIERHLRQEAVEASPPTFAYRAGKFVKRNRTAVVAAAAVVVALVGGIVASLTQAIRAENEREISENARLESEGVARFLEMTFQDPAPDRASHALTLAEMLDFAIKRLESDIDLPETTKARLLSAVGQSYAGIGMRTDAAAAIEEAVTIITRIRGEADPTSIELMDILADYRRHDGRFQEGIELATKVVVLSEETFGSDHPDTIKAMQNLADLHSAGGEHERAMDLMTTVVAEWTRLHGETNIKTLVARANMGLICRSAGRFNKAIEIQKAAAEDMTKLLGPVDPLVFTHEDRLANYYLAAHRYEEGLDLATRTLERKQQVFGEESGSALESMNTLGQLYSAAGDLENAIDYHEKTFALREKLFGPLHQDTLTSLHNLAIANLSAKRNAEGLKHAAEAHDRQEKLLGPDHFISRTRINTLARAYIANDRRNEAIALYRQALEIRSEVLGEKDPDTLISLNSLATALRFFNDGKEAIALNRKALALRTEVLGLRNPATINTMSNLALTLDSWHQPDEALGLFREALHLRETFVPQDRNGIRRARTHLINACRKAELHDEAAEIARRVEP